MINREVTKSVTVAELPRLRIGATGIGGRLIIFAPFLKSLGDRPGHVRRGIG
jgi:hypothetical protein